MGKPVKLLRMPENGDNYVPAADFLRVLSILLISWFHIWQQSWLNPSFRLGGREVNLLGVVRTGYIMVDIMLVISGFLLFLPYANAKLDGRSFPGVRSFYKKRAVRILPPYFLCLVIYLAVYILPNHPYPNAAYMWKDILGHFTFTQTWTAEAYIGTKFPAVLWTLAVEVQFYLIAPLVCRCFAKKPLLTYLVMTAAALMYRNLYVLPMNDCNIWFNRLPAMLDVYANGMLAAYAVTYLKRKKDLPNLLSVLVGTAGVVVCIAVLYLISRLAIRQSYISGYEEIRHGQMEIRYVLSLLGGLFLVSGTAASLWFQKVLGNRVIRFLSAVSYNYYIWHSHCMLRLKAWHFPPYENEMPQMAGEQPWQQHYTLLCFAFALVTAVLLTYLFEKPVTKKLTEWIKKRDQQRIGNPK